MDTRLAIMAQASLEPTPVGPEAGPTLNTSQAQAETVGIDLSTNMITVYFPDHDHPEKLHPNDRAYVLIQGQTVRFVERHRIPGVPWMDDSLNYSLCSGHWQELV